MLTVINEFKFNGEYKNHKPVGDGHINDTYLVDFDTNQYVIQRINHQIFTNPVGLMENVERVTQYIKKIVTEEGGNPEREVLEIIRTQDGALYTQDPEGNYWRAYQYISNATSFNLVEDPEVFYQSGVAFGKFQYQLSEFPVETLHYTIEKFHHTPSRYVTFEKTIARDPHSRAAAVQEDINFYKERADFMNILWDLHEKGEMPLKVTHNDTKLNNVMIDNVTKQALCVVDLDTVMPGFAVDDFGDAIRFGASTALEDEQDLNKVNFSIEYYEAFTKGFIEGGNGSFTDVELDQFAVGAKMMTLECGMRFLTDYIDGDNYFKTDYDTHNLVRSRTQMKLIQDMEAQWDAMHAVVNKYR